MQGIDIASYQSGIDLSVVPCDFAIVKATEGMGYINSDCSRAVEQCISLNKCFGVYHYVNGSGAVEEADYFVDNCSNWIGKGIFAIDWEAGGNAAWGNEGYLEEVVRRVAERIGVPPVIYASAGAFPWDVASRNNCATWVAQYADTNPTGYQDNPWNEDAYTCSIRQYASTGSLPGWDGSLDLNKTYFDENGWNAIAGNDQEDIVREEDYNAIAERVWSYQTHGFNGDVQARDRLSGIDWAVNENHATLGNTLNVKDGQAATDMSQRLAYMALFQKEDLAEMFSQLNERLDKIEAELK